MTPFGGAMELLGATIVASAIGSLHCVGMCGPFALIVSGNRRSTSEGWHSFALRLGTYHLGRLVTYLILGMGAGVFVGLTKGLRFGSAVGFGVGSLLVGLAVLRLMVTFLPSSFESKAGSLSHVRWIHAWGRQLARVRKLLPQKSGLWASFGWGLTTTWLPCGWLYLFVLTAAASTSSWMAVGTMIAFWIGTLPLLSLSVWGWKWMGDRWRPLSGVVSSISILAMGLYLSFARSSVDVVAESALIEHKVVPVKSRVEQSEPHNSDLSNETGYERLQRFRLLLNEGLSCCKGQEMP